MKEQDYMKLMGSIRGEFLEEAVSWDGSERRRIRQIRRMTVSFGAVAAALAVVIGMIAYKTNKDRIDTADSDTESSIIDDLEGRQNLYHGHGELRQITGANGTICYDDEYVYEWSAKWSVRSGGRTVRLEADDVPQNLYKDGEHLFTVHDNKIFETDSFGNETLLIDIAAFKTNQKIDTNRITKIQKLSNRLVALFTDEPQNITAETVLIADLQKKEITLQPEVGGSKLFPDTENSYYVFGMQAEALVRFDMDTGNGDSIWLVASEYNDPAYNLELKDAVMQNGKLYLTGKYYKVGEEDPNSVPDQYMVLDVETKKLTEKKYGSNERIYAGTAFVRAAIEDGSFNVYRSTLDLENEKLVFSVPVSQYLDTETYEMPDMPDFLSVYESDDMMIVHLPLSTDGMPRPSLHGEEGVLIDLKTGKTLYYGENYSLSTQDETSLAEHLTTTAVSGTGATVSMLSGTTVSANGTSGTSTSAAQTTGAQFTVAEDSNILGGHGNLIALGNAFWMDDGEFYELGQTGNRFAIDQDNNLRLSGSICRKNGCKHDNESCPIFHYNLEGIRTNPNSAAYDGQNVNLVQGTIIMNDLFVQRGTKLYDIDFQTGAETLWIDVKPFGGMNIGDNDLMIFSIDSVRGAHNSDIGKYLLRCGVSEDVPGVDMDASYLLLVDRNSNTQKLVGEVGPEGYDSEMLMWGEIHQDIAENGDIYVLQNGNTLVRFDTNLNRIGSYPLPVADDAKPCERAWCVVHNGMWYLNAKDQWCSFDLNTRAVTVVKEQTGISYHESGSPECISFENSGIFFAKKGTELMMFRYDMANTEMTGVPYYGLLFEQNINLFNGTFFGVEEDNPSGKIVFFNFAAPGWMPNL